MVWIILAWKRVEMAEYHIGLRRFSIKN